MDLKDGTLTLPVFKKLLKTHLFVTIWTAALRLCGDCMKGALQVPVSIQFNSIQYQESKLKTYFHERWTLHRGWRLLWRWLGWRRWWNSSKPVSFSVCESFSMMKLFKVFLFQMRFEFEETNRYPQEHSSRNRQLIPISSFGTTKSRFVAKYYCSSPLTIDYYKVFIKFDNVIAIIYLLSSKPR